MLIFNDLLFSAFGEECNFVLGALQLFLVFVYTIKWNVSSFAIVGEFYLFLVVFDNFVMFTHVYKICICIRCQLFALLEKRN
jgi:hypothetical protein